jgi:ABC-type tungstate transport system substrate-binding protein
MSLQTKIIVINIVLAIAVTLGFAFATDTFPGNGFFLMLAFIAACGGAGCVLLGLLLLLRKDKSAAKGYLTSGLLFLAVSAASYFFLQQY